MPHGDSRGPAHGFDCVLSLTTGREADLNSWWWLWLLLLLSLLLLLMIFGDIFVVDTIIIIRLVDNINK